MKKLMIAAAIVCAAVASQAGVIKWSVGGVGDNKEIYGPDASTLIYTWGNGDGKLGTYTAAILVNAAVLSQENFLKGIREAENAATYFGEVTKIDSNTVGSNSKIAAQQSPELAGGDYAAYIALLATDNAGNNSILFSSVKDPIKVSGNVGASVTATWSDAYTWSKTLNGEADYKGAGWYSVVPEPTSGLLLLLGVAGLALRRRRA